MIKPRVIEFTYSTGYWGMGKVEHKDYSHEVSNWQIAEDANKGAVANAAFYGIHPYKSGDEHNDYEYPCFIGDNIQGTWKEIV